LVIEVLVLGPIELRRDGEVVPVPGGKPRAVLAAVVIDPTRAVSQDRPIEALWGESAPARAASNLHVHVAALRKLVADDANVSNETTGGGYRLRIDPDHVDAFPV
jgi:DNA-binding SARP family transcriptional activator